MPIIKSAKKRVKVARKASILNSKIKRAIREAQKNLRSSVSNNKKDAALEHSRSVQSSIDKAVKKGIVSKNKAARKKSQLAAELKKLGAKPTKIAAKAKSSTKKATSKATTKPKPATPKKPTPKKTK